MCIFRKNINLMQNCHMSSSSVHSFSYFFPIELSFPFCQLFIGKKINNEILQLINTYKDNYAIDSFIVRTCKSSTASRWKNINFKIKL